LQIIYPATILVIVGMHRSAKDEVFTGDDLESSIGGPTTIIETDFAVDTQDYSVSTVTKAYVSHSDGAASPKEGSP
jgi:hypothetical protein